MLSLSCHGRQRESKSNQRLTEEREIKPRGLHLDWIGLGFKAWPVLIKKASNHSSLSYVYTGTHENPGPRFSGTTVNWSLLLLRAL